MRLTRIDCYLYSAPSFAAPVAFDSLFVVVLLAVPVLYNPPAAFFFYVRFY